MKKVLVLILLILSQVITPNLRCTNQTQEIYKTILETKGSLAEEQKNLKTIEHLIEFANHDLENLENQWLIAEEEIARIFQDKIDAKKLELLQNKQTLIEKQIEEVEYLVTQLKNEQDIILNPPSPELEPIVEEDPEIVIEEEITIEESIKEVVEIIEELIEEVIREKTEESLVVFTRKNRYAPKTSNKLKPRIFERFAPHIKKNFISKPHVINPDELRKQIILSKNKKSSATLRRHEAQAKQAKKAEAKVTAPKHKR